MDILKRISEHRAREEALRWEGTFEDYLTLVKKKPTDCRDSAFPCVSYD